MAKFVVKTTKNTYEIEAKNRKDAENQVKAKIRDASIVGNIYVEAYNVSNGAIEIAELIRQPLTDGNKNFIKQRINLLSKTVDKLTKLGAKL